MRAEIESLKNENTLLENRLLSIETNKPNYGNAELLYSGTLSKGSGATLENANWKKYNLFMAQTSDGLTIMIGMRIDSGDTAYIRFVGGYDNGSNSYMYKANTTINLNTNVFTNISCSMHLLGSSGTVGSVLSITKLWGII